MDASLAHETLSRLLADPFSSLPFVCGEQFFQSLLGGSQQYCSAALVNALLGYASHQYDLAGPSSPDFAPVPPKPAFIDEAKRLLSQEVHLTSIPSIQALGVLALVELATGRDDSAWEYMHACVKNCILRHLESERSMQSGIDDQEVDRVVLANVFCGTSSLAR